MSTQPGYYKSVEMEYDYEAYKLCAEQQTEEECETEEYITIYIGTHNNKDYCILDTSEANALEQMKAKFPDTDETFTIREW